MKSRGNLLKVCHQCESAKSNPLEYETCSQVCWDYSSWPPPWSSPQARDWNQINSLVFVYMQVRSTWEFSVLSLQFFYKSKFNPKFETIKDLRTRIIVTLRNTISMFNSIRAHPSPLLTTCVRQTQGPLPPVDMAGCTCAERHTGITLKCTALQTTPVHI